MAFKRHKFQNLHVFVWINGLTEASTSAILYFFKSNMFLWGHHASKFGIIYSNGGHFGFNYTHTSLSNLSSYFCFKLQNLHQKSVNAIYFLEKANLILELTCESYLMYMNIKPKSILLLE